ncbi:MAG TPA: histidine kinase N-terminal 7TM domain-containing protein [Anaerolineaceae bacterium]
MNLQVFLETLSGILAAGVVITAFSILLYVLTFNLRDRVTRSFTLILVCVVVIFTGEALASTATSAKDLDLWLRIQWVGIVFLPATYLHFSDALLATTGKISRGIWRVLLRLPYLVSIVGLLSLPFHILVGDIILDRPPAPYLQPTIWTDLFTFYYVLTMFVAWFNIWLAFRRTITTPSRRRMSYLLGSSITLSLGVFPYLLFSSEFASRHTLIFWGLAALANLLMGGMVVGMGYATAFFGVPWTDRVIKSRLFKWIMRGPVTASLTLGVVTILRRTGDVLGLGYTAFVPIAMVGTILLCEYLITLFAPVGERWLFYGNDQDEINQLRNLENRLLTNNDLRQFLEMVLAAVCDRLQAKGAYTVALSDGKLELIVTTGKNRFENAGNDVNIPSELQSYVAQNGSINSVFYWGEDLILPLRDETDPQKPELLGFLGVTGFHDQAMDREQRQALDLMTGRVVIALRDRKIQQKVFDSLKTLTPQVELIQGLRAAGRYDHEAVMGDSSTEANETDLVFWVREALTHYWGGPKLSESPLLQLRVVQDALNDHDDNPANALRSILRAAIDRVKPEGERRFTVEWILYNILEMKFVEGRKVREVALRLAMSEADLYRKQRVAIEAVAKAIQDMEAKV